jgi:hypothetical protein
MPPRLALGEHVMAAAGDDGQRGEHGGAYEILTDATQHGAGQCRHFR